MHDSAYLEKAKKILNQVKGKSLSVENRRELAIDLAALMMKESRRCMSNAEKMQADELASMLDDPLGKDFVSTLTDDLFRSNSNLRVADQLLHILKNFGVPKFLTAYKRAQLKIFSLIGKRAASLMVPLVKRMLRKQTSGVIISSDKSKIRKHVKQRESEGINLNINYLGEAILGEKEAQKRVQRYLNLLSDPKVNYVSVKISSIYSQINMLSPEKTLQVLAERLRELYRAAIKCSPPKFINLDMEEYDDLALTVALFKKVLDEPEFLNLRAGIVLQAYLPDSFLYQQEITLWAIKRLASGGAPVKLRLVKGANLAMEQLKARLKGWAQAPYAHKVDVDANYKRMLTYASQPENAQAVHVGIGSHNLFDVAYALLLRSENSLQKEIEFEMLEGMAMPQCRAVHALSKQMLLYCPVAAETEFQHAVTYLVRRLDENTSPDNFLRHAFNLIPGTRDWQQQASLFSLACHASQSVTFKPRRMQNRLTDEYVLLKNKSFRNEPDTDWSLPHNVKWGESLVLPIKDEEFPTIPFVIQGERLTASEGEQKPLINPSASGETFGSYSEASWQQVDRALSCAEDAESTWGALTPQHRSDILAEVALLMRKRRGPLIRSMTISCGKLVSEADVEVSEAIDFIEYYRRSLTSWSKFEGVAFTPKGVTVVLPPWNFPCAIPTGGIAVALTAGNPVLFKPAPEAVLVGYEIAKIFWEAGVPKDALHFVPMQEEPVGSSLIKDPRVKKVILTGGTETALSLISKRPDIDMMAETGGKNALIITAMADRDLAVKDVVYSAFGHAGQKCSACSLLILEKELYTNAEFLNHLKDAAKSMKVGSSLDLSSKINPLIKPPTGELLSALTELDEGEEWLLKPEQDEDNPYLWSPGIKLNVKPSSRSHMTEFFGPILSVMCAENLNQAIEFVKQVPYALTSGIHTLDEREIAMWRAKISAGNLYINRSVTGAIVQRQPFGGFKSSSFGDGYKAGGPHTLLALMNGRQTGKPDPEAVSQIQFSDLCSALQENMRASFNAAVKNYESAWDNYFSLKHDPSQILGQHNLLSFVTRLETTLRLSGGECLYDIMCVIAVFRVCGAKLVVSASKEFTFLLPESVKILLETDEELAIRISALPEKRVRFISKPTTSMYESLATVGATLLIAPVLDYGRIELLYALREVATSYDYHRYGNIPFLDPGLNAC